MDLMDRDLMIQAVRDYSADCGMSFEDIEPTAFFYKSPQASEDDVEVRAGPLSGNMDMWASEITEELLGDPQTEGFFAVFSILDYESKQSLLLISEQKSCQGEMSSFIVGPDFVMVNADHFNPSFLEGIDATVH